MNNCTFTKLATAFLLFVGNMAFSPSLYSQSPGNVSSDLYMWLRADEQVVLGSGADVQRWNDVSGNTTKFAIQGTANNRPTVVNSQINSNKVICVKIMGKVL